MLGRVSFNRMSIWGRDFEALHGGAFPEFREFSREFRQAAGPDLIPLVATLLDECRSQEARFLLAAILGDSKDPDAMPLLQQMVATSPGTYAKAVALNSIGMIQSPEGLSYLTGWLASARGKWDPDFPYLLPQALAAIGLHGAEALEFMSAEARKQGANGSPPDFEVLALVRGSSASAGLHQILAKDLDKSMRHGAALALGFSSRREDLRAAAESEWGAAALLGPRNVPEIWDGSADLRRKIAESVLAEQGIPKGVAEQDWACSRLAVFLTPEKARPVFSSIVNMTDFGGDPRGRIAAIIEAFADQTDLESHLQRIALDSKVDPASLLDLMAKEVEAAFLPGKAIENGPIIRGLQAEVRVPATHPFSIYQCLPPVMRSGVVSEATLSTLLKDRWNATSADQSRQILLGAVIQGATPSVNGLRCTIPEQFLDTVLKTETNDVFRLPAAHVRLVWSSSTPDADTLRSMSSLFQKGNWDAIEPSTLCWLLSSTMGTWYARFGTLEDIPRLERLPDAFPYPARLEHLQTNLRKGLDYEMKRAIDAIRLRN